MDHQQAAIRHLAGRLAAEIVWPNPTLLNPPEHFAKHLLTLICDADTNIGVPALAVAGPLIASTRGHAPDVDAAAHALHDTDLGDDDRLGHDIGIGFCRSAFTTSTLDRAILFLQDTIGDDTLPQDRKTRVFLSALGTILTVYTTAW